MIMGIEINWFSALCVIAMPIILGFLMQSGHPEAVELARTMAHEALPEKAAGVGDWNQKFSIVGVGVGLFIVYLVYQWVA